MLRADSVHCTSLYLTLQIPYCYKVLLRTNSLTLYQFLFDVTIHSHIFHQGKQIRKIVKNSKKAPAEPTHPAVDELIGRRNSHSISSDEPLYADQGNMMYDGPTVPSYGDHNLYEPFEVFNEIVTATALPIVLNNIDLNVHTIYVAIF